MPAQGLFIKSDRKTEGTTHSDKVTVLDDAADGVALVGVNYLPPTDTNVFLPSDAPMENLDEKESILKEYGLTYDDLPVAFSWKDSDWIQPAGNQQLCGSCWAYSSAQMFSDRWTVRTNGEEKFGFSPTYLLSCLSDELHQGCNGGDVLTTGAFLEKTGICTLACLDYSFCADNPSCRSGGSEGLGSAVEVPACPETCMDGGEIKLFRAADGTSRVVLGGALIKAEVWANGPVVGNFLVFADFDIGAMPGGWAKTNNIYVNGAYDNDTESIAKIKDPTIMAELKKGKKLSEIQKGGHAVSVVGWGHDADQDIYYWVCRNSWSERWQDEGFFKYAMFPNNIETGLEVPVEIQGYKFGGCIAWTPAIPNRRKTIGDDGGADKEGGPDGSDAGISTPAIAKKAKTWFMNFVDLDYSPGTLAAMTIGTIALLMVVWWITKPRFAKLGDLRAGADIYEAAAGTLPVAETQPPPPMTAVDAGPPPSLVAAVTDSAGQPDANAMTAAVAAPPSGPLPPPDLGLNVANATYVVPPPQNPPYTA